MLQALIHRLRHRSVMDRYFRSQTDARQTRMVLDRVASCPGCRARYDRLLMVERLRPDGQEIGTQRLWQAIVQSAAAVVPAPGAEGRDARSRGRGWVVAGLAVAAAAVLLVATPAPHRSSPIGDPVARGGDAAADAAPVAHFFRSLPGHRSQPMTGTLRVTDGVLVAYTNPSPTWRYLLVFGVDGQKHIYWYYPAYESRGTDPAAIAIRSDVAGIELGEEIRHDLVPGPLVLFAVFLSEPTTVLQIEDLIQKTMDGQHDGLAGSSQLTVPHALVQRHELQVVP